MTVPNLNPHRTYQIVAPKSTHFRLATCEEVNCDAWRNGWKTIVPADSPQAAYIKSGRSERQYVESAGSGAGLIEFTFFAGQKCFAAGKHMVPLERDPLFRVRDGAGAPVTHARPEYWTEDLSAHLDKVRRIREG